MPSRRTFLGAMSVPLVAPLTLSRFVPALNGDAKAIADEIARHDGPAEQLAGDEDFWGHIARAFTVDRSIVNLNNGGVSPSPAFVQDAMKQHLDYSNEAPPYTMWRVLEPQREAVRQRMARQFGCDAEELALTRNASEGLQTCQFGIDLAPGDEVLTTTQDYPRMLATFRQRQRRENIVLKQIDVPVPCADDAEVVRRFEQAITPRTKIILVCHMINLTGQILPVAKIVRMARRHNVPVIIDGAHALAHFDFTLDQLDCDYYATSLHKWLFAPHGTGLLYVRRDRVADLWPLMAAEEQLDDDIRKFEQIGTHPAANFLAIAEALTFHQTIGPARKETRLRHLRDTWARRLMQHDRIRLHTSLDPRFSCGIATVQIDGIDSGTLNNWLWREHRILTTAIKHDQFEGIRVSPSVYTTIPELERFCDVMERVAEHGLPA